MPRLHVEGAEKFARLATELRGSANKAVRQETTRAIRAEAKPVVADVRRAVMAIPSSSGSRGSASRAARVAHQAARSRSGRVRMSRGLRATIAAATGVEVRLSGRTPTVRIVVRKSGFPADQRRLPSRLNSTQGWRHPVFGHRDRWVHQDGRPYFDVTIRRHAPRFRRAVVDAVERAASKVARGR